MSCVEGSLWELLRRGTWAKSLTCLMGNSGPLVGLWNEHAPDPPKACPACFEVFLSFSREWDDRSNLLGPL
uniref:Uncharacterized protein n=1 Tax=Marmota marmota marmota TaxID=9994 RepID=A0A8C5YQ36_MARMA